MSFFGKYVAPPELDFQRHCLRLNPEVLASPTGIPSELYLFTDGKLTVHYAPMSLTIDQNAKILIVGLTPGWAQAKEAYVTWKLAEGDLTAYRRLSKSIAFKGSMRTGIYKFFENLGINEHLGVKSIDELFHSHDLATTSILRYPVYNSTELTNYSGDSAVTRNPFLMAMVDELFIPLVNGQTEALIVPMGKFPELVLKRLASLDPDFSKRVLWGFPHMSGANNGRIKPAWEKHNESWKKTVEGWKSSQ